MNISVRHEDSPEYLVYAAADTTAEQGAMIAARAKATAAEDETLKNAREILTKRLMGRRLTEEAMTSPGAVRQFLELELAEEKSEVFAVIFLDAKHRPVAFERMFFGTLDSSSVHPREVARAALRHNAGAVILAHNHPSGVTTPSHADFTITEKLTEALGLLEIRVLDHVIVGEGTISFAERGQL